LGHILAPLWFASTRNVLPATWGGLLRRLSVSHRFSTRLLNCATLRTLLFKLLLFLLLSRSTFGLFPGRFCLALLLLQILQLSPRVSITLCRFRR
jgi:hypothetical protein